MPRGITGFLGWGETLKNLERLLESLTRGQANALGGLDLDLLLGLWIDAGAGLAVHNLECAKADQLKALVLLDEGLDVVDDGVHCLFGVGLADILAKGFLDGFNEMDFAAHGLLGWVGWVGCVV